MASIRKRTWTSGNEVKTAWVADYFDQSGKRHIKTFQQKKAAEAWLVNARHEVAKGIHTPDSSSITVSEAADLWIKRGEAEGLERSTLDKYKSHVNLYIKPRIGGIKLSRLSAPAVEEFKENLMLPPISLSRPMAAKVLGSLKSLLTHAQRRGLAAQNAAAPVRLRQPGRDKARIQVGEHVPTKAEIQKIISAADGRWKPLFIVAAFSGLRSSELRGLTWDDVDLDKKLLRVRQRADQWNQIGPPKSKAGQRVIPLSPLVVNTLKEWKLQCPRLKEDEGPGRLWLVFPNSAGKPEYHSNIINRGLDPVLRKAGCVFDKGERDKDGKLIVYPKYSMHSFRHFFASLMIERGFTPKKLQELLGHSSITMTFDTYGHLFPNLEDDHMKLAEAEASVLQAPRGMKTAT